MLKYTIFACLLAASAFFPVDGQTYDDSPADFFFSKDVSIEPAMMSQGFISTGMDERSGSMGPENKTFYFSIRHGGDLSVIFVSRYRDGFWEFPEVAEFSGEYRDASPFVSPDGRFLYFTSRRPRHQNDSFPNWNIWRCRRQPDGDWGKPELLSFCSEERNELSVSVDRDGNLYFHGDYESETVTLSPEAFDIYSVKLLADDEWGEIKNLGPVLNMGRRNSDPAISPDGNCLVFQSAGQKDYEKGDLYISFRDHEGWESAVNLGRAINSGANDCCPAFTADGRYLLFSSDRKRAKPEEIDYSSIKKWILGPGNGKGDIYYLDAGELESFRDNQP